MVAGIYMSILIIILELWMIIRTTNNIIVNDLYSQLPYYFNNYYRYYLILLVSGIIMLIYSVLYVRGKVRSKAVGSVIKCLFSLICI